MAETTNCTTHKSYAVVTGANKRIGFEICRQLASHGITVVLTARDEKRGLDALQKLKDSSDGISGDAHFHQLDVEDSSSVSSIAEFIKIQFGRLDILVNNAGITGALLDPEALKSEAAGDDNIDWNDFTKETKESVEQCLQINYYGAKRMTEALIPLLQLSESPRIMNVTSSMGKLEKREWMRC
ncbi:hypothetical protein ACH5RR_024032 [Cinchona calisaya]|uniref:Uncharacterized protein n=1 Tax=Cinchona calisaya TaxID=153742 RepID=A0ABD2ZCC0_9GENT